MNEMTERAGIATCPVCRSPETRDVLRVGEVPIDTNRLWANARDAKRAPTGTLDLTYCRSCTHLFNRAYDDASIDYEADYENSQMFSPRFRAYAVELADRLGAAYDLREKDVVEIGGGRGDFLAVLVERAGCRGTSFGPSYRPSENDAIPPGVRFVTDYYSEKYASMPSDLILCRHVLEHFDRPRGLVEAVRRAIADRDVAVYFEVPSADDMLEHGTIYDLIYSHPSYFTRASLGRLFDEEGFDVVRFGEGFEGQFLWIEAKARDGSARAAQAAPAESGLAGAACESTAVAFGAAWHAETVRWRATFDRLRAGTTILWGAGAKSVTFLNQFVPVVADVAYVVDVNPRKTGKFTAGTGHAIVSPEHALAHLPQTVLVANPVYLDEIRASFADVANQPDYVPLRV